VESGKMVGKDLNMIRTYCLIMIKNESNEQKIRGDIENLQISSILLKVFEKSDRINKIPSLNYSKIKERIIESYIEGIRKKGKIDNPS
jgi:hypothetical protein